MELDAFNHQWEKMEMRQKLSKLEGVNVALGSIPAETLITEKGLAQILGKCTASIKAAVKAGELPRPARLMGKIPGLPAPSFGTMDARIDSITRKISRLSV